MDNRSYQITGSQPTATAFGTDLVTMARGAGLAQSAWAADEEMFDEMMARALTEDGPWLIAVRIDDKPGVGATERDPVLITDRFMRGMGTKRRSKWVPVACDAPGALPLARGPESGQIALPAAPPRGTRDACDTHCHVFGPASRFPMRRPQLHAAGCAAREISGHARHARLRLAARWCRARRTGATMRRCSMRWSASPNACAASRSPMPTHRRPNCAAGMPSAYADLRFNHFFRDGQLHYRGGVPLDAARTLAPVMKELGWHLQLWIDVKDLPDTIPILKELGLPVVIDHMGRTDAAGTAAPGFQSLVRLLGEGGCWVKLSGAHRVSQAAPDYPEARALHEALVAANPEQLRLGLRLAASAHRGRNAERRTPARPVQRMDAGRAIRQRILVDNPARLYDFPRCATAGRCIPRRSGS